MRINPVRRRTTNNDPTVCGDVAQEGGGGVQEGEV